ncbi:MAG: hypothetical protein MUC95_06535 [Spirochaetes bacterium]|jgi:hypothetical protein|nr:hypothetical protein [Spirochaetota bacterium]
MIELKKKDKEVDITLKYSQTVGGRVKVDILGEGDLSHHLIEGLFDLVDRLARMEVVGHQSSEWRQR